jgi:hypothetical protein
MLMLATMVIVPVPVRAASTYYVNSLGNDSADGRTTATALRTIQRCAELAQPGDTCQIAGGVYRETVRPPRNGTPAAPIQFRADPADPATISALRLLSPGSDGVGQWERHSPTIARVQLPASYDRGIGRNVLFVDGVMQMEARWPNMPSPTRLHRADYALSAAGSIVRRESASHVLANYAHPDLAAFWAGAQISFSPGYEWWGFWGDVTSASAGMIEFRFAMQPSQEPYAIPHANDPFFLWGKLEALDAPGEFFLDRDGSYGPRSRCISMRLMIPTASRSN